MQVAYNETRGNDPKEAAMVSKRFIVFTLLALVWLLIALWQVVEHRGVRLATQGALLTRAHDLAATLGVVMRSQGRFGMIPQSKLEAALDELTGSTELKAVALLNAAGEITASSGEALSIDPAELLASGEHWEEDTATFANLVALGPNTASGFFAEHAPLILPTPEGEGWREPGGPPIGEGRGGPDRMRISDGLREIFEPLMNGVPLNDTQVAQILAALPQELLDEQRRETCRRALIGRPLDAETLRDFFALLRPDGPGGPGRPDGPPPHEQERDHFRRPPWMSDAEYDRLVKERGVHWLVVKMPITAYKQEVARDAQARGFVLFIAFIACLAFAVAWAAFARSAGLQIRLVRAEEMSKHLGELNMAAAGLVHETKNPLNIIRGQAQMIAREAVLPHATRETAIKITEEADRVTGRLNQFLDYSRPVAPVLAPVNLRALGEEVFGILDTDREDKSVTFAYCGTEASVLADREMLRQVLFNLLLNALQAVGNGGRVEVHCGESGDACVIEVRDNGPGVRAEDREAIFRPYFTTTQQGTGLGLAVVRQIALAHQWDVVCSGEGPGATFRISRLATAPLRPAGYTS
jgi:signal transduction histidine kinase